LFGNHANGPGSCQNSAIPATGKILWHFQPVARQSLRLEHGVEAGAFHNFRMAVGETQPAEKCSAN
jgi:hypothetical protein